MKQTLYYLSLLCLALSPRFSFAQEKIHAVNDTFCITLGQQPVGNVKTNDQIPDNDTSQIQMLDTNGCFEITKEGVVFLRNGAACCGDHHFKYRYLSNLCDNSPDCMADVFVTVKCCKTDCFSVDMDDLSGSNGAAIPDNPCVDACANSQSKYFVQFVSSSHYHWQVTGGTFVVGADSAEILITWGAMGNGSVSVAITDSNGNTVLKTVCVTIEQSPVADFTAPDSVCLREPISFGNISTNGNDFFWDFGDGTSSSMYAPTHAFTSPGIKKVCLIVKKTNFGIKAGPSCCCIDTICKEIVVSPLAGPNIYCISTLCAHDSTKYWTDALDCSKYYWSVKDENGSPVTFSGQGNNMIFVHWGAGPVGTVSLYTENCKDQYCNDTVSETIPIIPATTLITGLQTVCVNSTESYSLPKWISAHYTWSVTGVNASILSGEGTNTVVIKWNSFGTGIIHVDYSSDFLSGLPGEVPSDCMDFADLKVEVKPPFAVSGLSQICIDQLPFFSTTANVTPPNCNWNIRPPADFTGQGTNVITVTKWNSGPGTYVVSAIPLDPTVFCNDSATHIITVLDVPPPTGIEGPKEICLGETYTYIGQTTETGLDFSWAVTGGTGVPASGIGNTISVTWDNNPGGIHRLSLIQTRHTNPMCMSNPFILDVKPKLLKSPLGLNGVFACIDTIESYSADTIQHPDATFEWTIIPEKFGSVISGQGTRDIKVQWNHDSGVVYLKLKVKLCNDSLMDSVMINIYGPKIPMIMAPAVFCPGGTGTLDAGVGFASYQWSTGATTQTIPLTQNGLYRVNTVDGHGCKAFDYYKVEGGPTAEILSATDTKTICLPGPGSIKLTAHESPGYQYTWYCNGVDQLVPSSQSFFVHTNDMTVKTVNYVVVVTDAKGCVDTSAVIQVQQIKCEGDPIDPCHAQSYTLSFTAIPEAPNCNVVDFIVSSSNVVLNGWDFDDPGGNLDNGIAPDAKHTYTTADCHFVVLKGLVPNDVGGFCEVATAQLVCVKIAPAFIFSTQCGTVSFQDRSTVQSGESIISHAWTFAGGTPSSSTATVAVVNYPAPGSYSVTLTVTSASGCQVTTVQDIIVDGVAAPVLSASPSPYCVGNPINFSAPGTGIVSWLWDFNDTATNGSDAPSHTYLSAGNYNVSLTVTNAAGCQRTVSVPVPVNDLPSKQPITVSPGLKVCKGDTVTLTAPIGPGYSYHWSTLETTSSIKTDTAGTFHVTVTDANGCTMVPDPVTVVILPVPPAFITGKNFICDSGCVTLSAPPGNTYIYLWKDMFGALFTTEKVTECGNNFYTLTVTDTVTGCTASVATPFFVNVVSSPVFSINISPDACAGKPVTLSIVGSPSLTYTWSNGATGLSTTVQQAGVYSAVGVDPVTGCSGTADAVIHPQPDLCLVPVGCYETCNPDSICGPTDLAVYQWNLNGTSIPGATNPCVEVTKSGIYTLTGTTFFGCALTSDSLKLKVIECDCYGLDVTAKPVTPDSCCWAFSYKNPRPDLVKLVIHSNDADFNFNPATVSSPLVVQSSGPNTITLVHNPLPTGALNNFIALCLKNLTHTPQKIIFDWYDIQMNRVCSDTVELQSKLITRSKTISLCPGRTITINGTVYTGPGTVIVKAPGALGACDTVITYTLIVLPQPKRSQTISFCPGRSVTIGGHVYTAPGTVIDTIPGLGGACDTIVTYTLIVLPQPTRSETIDFCPGDSVIINGIIHTSPGTVVITRPGTGGACDTIVTYTLKFLTPAPSTVTIHCPDNISLTIPTNTGPTVVHFEPPTASSDCICPGVSIKHTPGPNSGDHFPTGTTTVCYTAKDSCGNSASCCFKIDITEETPCDVKVVGCLKFELLSITKNAAMQKTYRMRVTNNCSNQLMFAAFELPDGLHAVDPLENSVYTAPSSRQYLVRNPNESPFYSIRFKSMATGISGGGSDIFKYTLPAQADPLFIHVGACLADIGYTTSIINVFNCPIGMTPAMKFKPEPFLRVFPNPTSGILFADLSGWEGEQLRLMVFSPGGQRMLDVAVTADTAPQLVPLPEGLNPGLYALEILTVNGEREVVRFVITR